MQMSALQKLVIISLNHFIFVVYLTMLSVAQPVTSYLLYRPTIKTIVLAIVYIFSNMQHVSPVTNHHQVPIIKMLRENFNVQT
jgi:hypothetical protein